MTSFLEVGFLQTNQSCPSVEMTQSACVVTSALMLTAAIEGISPAVKYVFRRWKIREQSPWSVGFGLNDSYRI